MPKKKMKGPKRKVGRPPTRQGQTTNTQETPSEKDATHHKDMSQQTALWEFVRELWLQNHLTDITVQCHGQQFHSHRVVLAAYSRELYRMLAELAPDDGTTVNMNLDLTNMGLSSHTLQSVLNYFYTGEIDMGNKELMLLAAKALDIPQLEAVLKGSDTVLHRPTQGDRQTTTRPHSGTSDAMVVVTGDKTEFVVDVMTSDCVSRTHRQNTTNIPVVNVTVKKRGAPSPDTVALEHPNNKSPRGKRIRDTTRLAVTKKSCISDGETDRAAKQTTSPNDTTFHTRSGRKITFTPKFRDKQAPGTGDLLTVIYTSLIQYYNDTEHNYDS